MKLKMIAAAVALVAAGSSFATLTPADNLGNGEMILVVWDAGASYTRDLGITFNQFLASSNNTATWATQTSTTSTNWTNFLAGADLATVQYAVINANTGTTTGAILSTIDAASVGNVIGNFNGTNVTSAVTQVSTYYGNLQYSPGATFTTQTNGDSRNLVGSAGYFGTTAMDSFNGSFYGNSSLVGTDMAFDLVKRVQSGNADPIETLQAGVVSFKKVSSDYVLQYSVQAVPEASGYAMALAGFGLIGFVGIRRRNKQA